MTGPAATANWYRRPGVRGSASAAAFAAAAVAVVALAAGGAPSVATAASAKAKALKGSGTDPKGDAPTGSVDIVGASAKYAATGSLSFTVTMAGALDFTKANGLVVLLSAGGCGRNLIGAGVDLTDPTVPWAYRFTKKPREIDGQGKAKGSKYSASFRSSELGKQKPAYLQVAIYPPGDNSPDPLDETDCITLR